METPVTVVLLIIVSFFLSIFTVQSAEYPAGDNVNGVSSIHRRSQELGLCAELIQPSGYPCSEHIIQTKDGYLLALHRVSSSIEDLSLRRGPPVLLQHGLFMGGDAWFLNSKDQSLGFILADQGFDVWVGNVRGTRWSHGHVSLSEKDKDFWDWSWQDIALYDLAEMIHYINSTTNTKTFVVGHSQGSIVSLAAFTQPDIVEMVEAAAFLCPISYLNHISAPLVLKMVSVHLDQMIVAMGVHELNFRSDFGVQLLDSICNGHVECNNLLTSITGMNCCFNNSRVDFYLEYEPHPSSSKNLNHLFQMIRKGSFAKYDYGLWKNVKLYGHFEPPEFNINRIPKSLPLWMGYGGNDELADLRDVQHTLNKLQSEPELLYLDNYGHIDFLLSVTAKEDVYDKMIDFFRSCGKFSSEKKMTVTASKFLNNLDEVPDSTVCLMLASCVARNVEKVAQIAGRKNGCKIIPKDSKEMKMQEPEGGFRSFF